MGIGNRFYAQVIDQDDDHLERKSQNIVDVKANKPKNDSKIAIVNGENPKNPT